MIHSDPHDAAVPKTVPFQNFNSVSDYRTEEEKSAWAEVAAALLCVAAGGGAGGATSGDHDAAADLTREASVTMIAKRPGVSAVNGRHGGARPHPAGRGGHRGRQLD